MFGGSADKNCFHTPFMVLECVKMRGRHVTHSKICLLCYVTGLCCSLRVLVFLYKLTFGQSKLIKSASVYWIFISNFFIITWTF